MSGKGVEMRVSVPGKGNAQVPPSSQLGTRLPVQDYDKLRRQCLAENKLFEDPYFPANDSSLFFSQALPFNPKWIRPKDIVSAPKLFTGGASRFDVSQGMLGNCWLVAAIASLTQDKILLSKVIPQNQDFDRGYAGIFHFMFWHFGEWVDIVVDDRLPSHNGKLIFIHSTEDNEFWSALLEKAYAKLHGGYEALKGGNTSEAMVDFTGGVVEPFKLKEIKKEDLLKQINKGAKRSSLMSCSIAVTSQTDIEAKLSTGLVKGHAYSVTGSSTLTVKGKEVNLVRIRNPWGQKEWNGSWSDNSTMWKQVPAAKRAECLEQGAKEDGEFWMSIEDMMQHYTDFEICSVSVNELQEDSNVKNWNSIVKSGSWVGEMAGGCRNYPTFVNNPQFVIDLEEDDDGDGKCSIILALMQKDRRKQKKMGVQDLCIGFSVYKAPPDGSPLTKKYVDYNLSVGNSGSFTNAREVHKKLDLDPGKYVILPCAFKPGEQGDFLLRIFTEKSSKKAVNKDGGVAMNSKVKVMFDKLAGADGEIDSEELQDMLTVHFAKDLGQSVFALDACRSMIAMLDVDKNGTLNITEFQALLNTIMSWKKMFSKFDRDRSGTLEKREVAEAVRSLGYSLSSEALNVLFNRFAKRRRYMNIDDFASCLSRVKLMNDAFGKFQSGGSAKFTQDQFMKITLDA